MFLTVTDDIELTHKLLKLYNASLNFSFFSGRDDLTKFAASRSELIELCIIDSRYMKDYELNSICKYIRDNIPKAKICALLKRRPSDTERFLRSKLSDAQLFENFSETQLANTIKSLCPHEISHPGIVISINRNETYLWGYALHLTPSEHKLIALLVKYPENIFSASDASSLVGFYSASSVAVHVCAINRKSSRISGRPLILSKYGKGYYISPSP